MNTVMWTFKVPAGTAKAQLVETINATAHTYEGIPGLILQGLAVRLGVGAERVPGDRGWMRCWPGAAAPPTGRPGRPSRSSRASSWRSPPEPSAFPRTTPRPGRFARPPSARSLRRRP